ncbi:hypothetical protein [Capnocytophaga cynodegmi]|uniref:hypothetical protein n=1 Tax=Capnocytophaga cynodegmi TaxID=28189 RepID=UPI0038596EFF
MNWLKKLYKKLEPLPLEKTITGIAYPIPADKLRNLMIVEINDKVYRQRATPYRKFDWETFRICFFVFLVCLFFSLLFAPNFDSDSIRNIIYVMIFPALLVVFVAVDPFIAPYRELVLNREKGTISIPKMLRKENIIIRFDEGDGYMIVRGDESSLAFALEFAKKGNPSSGGEIANLFLDEFWDFVVWYMDKNRPLPPGTAFDPYREADYQRRKAEGFPPPLYPSKIETPEATPEQQAERKRIGKW